ncbi:MAG: FKBP-type peptidyl-prolyl cis-trans isomerase [Cyclobacteriaceae bacterium]|nr:FKBP-type peptidyl-prolyl cis-trans isomerase [Cyclobacteriaceae bacterium]
MKKLHLLLPFIMLFAAACSTEKKDDRGIVIGDTITTASGLKYVFMKIGEGRPVATGSRVYTYLALSVNGKEIWNTNDMKDSAFVFVANKDRMITGFTEVTMKLREGDEIAAVLPGAIAYGERGAGSDIPPNATLVYTKYKMMKVDEARASLSDTLFQAYKSGGHEAMIAARDRVMSSPDTAKYYYSQGEWRLLWNLLNDAQMHNEALQMIAYANTDNNTVLRLARVRSYDQLGQFKQALDSLEVLFKSDPSLNSSQRATDLRESLRAKLQK